MLQGWYLRGFIGVGMNGNYTLDYLQNPGNAGNGFVFQSSSISDATFIGGGVGYEWNNWLRFEGTAEYRSKARRLCLRQLSARTDWTLIKAT